MKRFSKMEFSKVNMKYKTLDYKTELVQFFEDLKYELCNPETLAQVKCKKETFKQMLRHSHLDYLFEDRDKSVFEWKCYFDLLNMMYMFDQAIQQITEGLNLKVYNDKELKDKMSVWYSGEYK